MENEVVFRTVSGDFEAELEEKRSVFIAAVRRVETAEQAEGFVRERKKAHPAARHTVYAYLLRDGTQRYADDSEPQGTAGLPTLERIRRAGLSDVCVATTRYFGGILLGTGGLTRAYGSAAGAVLDKAQILTFCRFAHLTVSLSYTDYQKIVKELPRFGGREEAGEFADAVLFRCRVPAGAATEFCARVTDVTAGRATPCVTGETLECDG